jgi:penicillin-binding protein 2
VRENRFTHYLVRRSAPPPSVGQQLDLFGHPHEAEREQYGFLARVLLLALLLIAGMGLLAMRISYLTLARGEALYELCERNYIAQEKIPAPRGMITDRYGRVIATSEPRFDLSISPFHLQALQVEQTLAGIARFLPGQRLPSADDVMHTAPRWKRVRVASNLTSEQATPLLERQSMLPGLVIEQGFRRSYPQGHVTSLLTGFVGPITESELPERLEEGYDRGDLVGRMGLEREFEKDLRGEKGSEIVYRDAKGRLKESPRILPGQEAAAGARVVLTIDMRLQNLAAELLVNTSGTLVAMDPRNGEVLAMVSNPDFDANIHGSETWTGNSSYNKALRSYYSPGSTFKIVTASAWLMAGKGSPQRTVDCEGQFDLGSGKHLNCMLRSGHGPVAMTEAFAVSCNVYFSQLASELDTDDFVAVARRYGYGQPTGISLHGLGDAGLLGPRAGPPPTRTDRVMMGVGQGRLIAVTPLQMASAYSTVANGGTRYGARIVRRIERPGAAQPEEWLPTVQAEVGWTPEQHKAVLDGLRSVIEAPSGTGRHGKFDPAWHVAGKTGTAETGREDPDAWFICFAPYEKPEICIAILIEQGGHGGEVAAPLARTFLEEYFRFR